jgi:hypothetical protein
VIRRNANRRHMTDDHHGWTAGGSNSTGQSRGRDSRHARVPLAASAPRAGPGR